MPKNSKEKLAYIKEWQDKNKDRVREYKRKHYAVNKESYKERSKTEEYRAKHREYCKKYRENNKEKIAEYRRKRLKEDSIFKLRYDIRTLIKNSIKYRGHKEKNTKTEQILGCSIEEFIKYLQSKFQEGMTLENHRRMAYRPYNTYI